MIRKLEKQDIDDVMVIWLNSNKQAHHFIAATYWENHFEMVRASIQEANVYVYEIHNKVVGFIGLMENEILGLFVKNDMRSKGIGRALINFCKKSHYVLNLNVYEKNTRALSFYKKNGFDIVKKQIDQETNEIEYYMRWKV